MEKLEKKMLKTIMQNLENSSVQRNYEDDDEWARRMAQTIQQAIPMFKTLMDDEETSKEDSILLR